MIYSDFKGLKLSKLGFGTMRLPLLEDKKTIDKEQVALMTRYAIEHGVNYFDTAFPYHGGLSEVVIGEILKDYPRESWYLADKYPGHQHSESFNPAETFELQLQKCGVDYFDFYLLHNVCENSMDNYMNPKWGMADYFVEQRRLGRIKHLGFSSHADLPALQAFLDSPYGAEMEFCQIQLNYLDWTLQKAREKCEIIARKGIPIWVMEPLRGGFLAHFAEEKEAVLKNLRPDESVPSWAFRWLQGLPGVTMILSGMSDFSQMQDNVRTFESESPLTESETATLMDVAASLHNPVPCTGCRYCCDGCPMGLDIPTLIAAYNDFSLGFSFTPLMRIETLPEDKQPSACLGCGACEGICPQGLPIPEVMSKLADKFASTTKWADICRQRAEEAARLAASSKN